MITGMRGSDYMSPVLPGYESFDGPCYVFLLHHEPTKTRLLFDLGIRVDWRTAYAPEYIKLFDEWGMGIRVERDVSDILDEHGIPPVEIDAVIFSHHHFDHIGNMTKFPTSTKIIVGPGYKTEYLPGYPLDPEELETTSDLYQDRDVVEIEFSTIDPRVCTIGEFSALDYFSDGSLYLLSTPGHTVGHLSALARTTSSNQHSTFVFLGGDIVSSSAVFRPSESLPLPDQVCMSHGQECCPGDLLAKLHRSYRQDGSNDSVRTTPFCEVAGEDDDLAESQRNAT